MNILITSTGLGVNYTATIRTVSYWSKNSSYKNEPISKKELQNFLEAMYPDDTIVLTERGNLYLTSSTPGYCDGEVTIPKQDLINLINQ